MPQFNTKIIRSKRKTLALSVTRDAMLVVKAPKFTPQMYINSFIKLHENWIHEQIARALVHKKVSSKTYQDGETFLFLGIERKLRMGDYPEVVLKQNTLYFPQVLQFRAQKQLISWYKKQARDIISQQVREFSSRMNTSCASLTFSDTRSQWGSCTVDNKLQFSWRLIMAPILVVNYVVVHELAHTIEKNHSRDFWRIVRSYCPSYNRQRKWLNDHGNELVV